MCRNETRPANFWNNEKVKKNYNQKRCKDIVPRLSDLISYMEEYDMKTSSFFERLEQFWKLRKENKRKTCQIFHFIILFADHHHGHFQVAVVKNFTKNKYHKRKNCNRTR